MSEGVPEVVGLRLAEAEARLAAMGTLYQVRKTYPRPAYPGQVRLGSEWRVIQQRSTERGVLLVIAQSLAPPREDDQP